ncbi:MAG: hypothetical protein AB4372_38205 [Xenococcus sp. (in: cyanobacteria)]
MPKISDCDRCSFYANNPHLVCAINPSGVDSDRCLDFRLDPNFQEEEQWSPKGYSWYDGELIPNRPSRYTAEEQLEILDNHPFFTGICPQCGYEFDKNNLPLIHFDCPSCGWVDDSV